MPLLAVTNRQGSRCDLCEWRKRESCAGRYVAALCLHTASPGFTLAVRQLLAPICLGGAVVIAREDELRHPLALLRAAKRAGVTVLDLVPSLLRAVRQLERSIGQPLLRNDADGVSTTVAGRDLARRLGLAMHEVELGIEELANEVEHGAAVARDGSLAQANG